MNTDLTAVFAECADPSVASKADVQDQLGPILSAVAKVQGQIAAYRSTLFAAGVIEDNRLERLHGHLGAMEADCKQMIDAGRRLVTGFARFDADAASIQADIETQEAKEAAATAAEPTP